MIGSNIRFWLFCGAFGAPFLATPQTTEACSCGDVSAPIHPVPGATNVPQNSQVRILSPGIIDLYVDVEGTETPIDHTIAGEFSQSSQAVMTVTFDDLLPEGAIVRVGTSPGLDNLTHFTVGSEIDTEPPRWRGVASRKSHRKPKDCAYGPSHELKFSGVSDDMTDKEDLLVRLEPVDVGNTLWGNRRTAYVVEEGCGPIDRTLATDFHRAYTVTFTDMAGNTSKPKQLNTCGCATAPGAHSLLWGLLAIPSGRRRRWKATCPPGVRRDQGHQHPI